MRPLIAGVEVANTSFYAASGIETASGKESTDVDAAVQGNFAA
jgi:hypothetical protein